MSFKQDVLNALEPMHERLSRIEGGVSNSADRLRRIEGKLDRVIAVFVDAQAEVDGLRARVLEQAACEGETLERHGVMLADHETRLQHIEAEQDDAAE